MGGEKRHACCHRPGFGAGALASDAAGLETTSQPQSAAGVVVGRNQTHWVYRYGMGNGWAVRRERGAPGDQASERAPFSSGSTVMRAPAVSGQPRPGTRA